jgi:hypothetical protein
VVNGPGMGSDGETEAFDRGDGLIEWRFREEEDEFFAAVAGDVVDVADVVTEEPGDGLDDLVAGLVGVAIVDRFEVVDVEYGDRQGMLEPGGPVDLTGERLVERTAVGETRQRVLRRLAL